MATFTNQLSTKTILFSITLLFSFSCYSQYGVEFDTYKAKWPEAKKIHLQDHIIISVELNNEDFEITQSFIKEVLYMDESATYGSKESLSFSSFFELEDIKAYSFQNVDGKYKSFEVSEFTEKDDLDNSFHDDVKILNFIYPNLSKASKTKLEYSEKIKNPRFLSPFYFRAFHPINHKKVTIIADKNIEFRFQEYNTQGYDIRFEKVEKRNTNIYSWEIKNIDQIKTEENVPSYKSVLPHIVPIIVSYNINNEHRTLSKDVSDLYNWYFTLTKDINLNPADDGLVKLTNSLIENKTSNLEKVKAIYYWVQQHIKYIDFEFELGGFIPREANDVFQKKYGDCKDNSSILFEMLRIANLEGYLTWIGTRQIPYSYQEVPTPIVDNHMILTYLEDEQLYFLDATGRHLPIDLPSGFIQGKEAMIGMGENKFKIVTVPVVEPNKNSYNQKTILEIKDQTLRGNSTVELSGYFKVDVFNQLESKNSDQKLLEYYNAQFRKGNNKFLITNFEEKNKFDYESNFVVSYDFNIDNYPKKLSDELFINLNLNKELSNYKVDKDRENDIEIRYKANYQFENTLKIPSNYSVEYLPQNFSFEHDLLSSSISYMLSDNSVIYKHTITLDYLTISPEQQKIVNKLIQDIENQYKEIIILKKNNP
jgi:hypothetical protein